MSKLNEKLNELFGDAKKEDDLFKKTMAESSLNMEDFTPEERKEVEDAVRDMQERRPKEPETKFKWTFSGRLLFKILMFLIEYLLLVAVIMVVIPLSIDVSFSIIEAFIAGGVLTFFRFWWN
jgi:hypothetical protein